jgi:Flp pilus assembly protein TadG
MTRWRWRRRGRNRSRGQGLVEVALVLPVFLLLMMTLLDFGRVIYAQNSITQDAREAVRRGMVSAASLTTADFPARFQAIRDAGRLMSPAVPITDESITGGGGACSTVKSTPIFGSPDMANDTKGKFFCFYPNGVVNTNPAYPPKVVVQIHVRVNFITPLISNILGGGIDISAQSEQLIQS